MPRYAFLALLCLVACDRGEPPKGPSSTAATATAATASASAPHRRRLSRPRRSPGELQPAGDAAATVDGGPDSGAEVSDGGVLPAALAPPPLLGPDHRPLPQTEDQPAPSSAWFDAGVRALFRAIQADDPSIAEPFFFPLIAYEQVKDVKEPKRDWERRLMANFRRDVHDYHKRLGPKAADARFVSIELPKERMKWMKPRSEGNKLGYFRVTRNRLRYQAADGKPATLEVTSLISWRGEWYLVHLNGFE